MKADFTRLPRLPARHGGQAKSAQKIMKKITLLFCALALAFSLPLAARASAITDAVREIGSETWTRIENLNVTGGIKNKRPGKSQRVHIQDSMKVNKVAIMKGNAVIRGVIKNTLKGIPVKIDDELRVYGFSNFKDIVKVVGLRLTPTDVMGVADPQEGDVYFDDNANAPFVYNGAAWAPMVYSAGSGLALVSGEFSVDEGDDFTWTGAHTFDGAGDTLVGVESGANAKAGFALHESGSPALWEAYNDAGAGDKLKVNSLDNDDIIVVDENGKIGLNNASPTATLDVNFWLRLTPTDRDPLCSTDTTGGMFMYGTATSAYPCFCDGTDWYKLEDYSSACH